MTLPVVRLVACLILAAFMTGCDSKPAPAPEPAPAAPTVETKPGAPVDPVSSERPPMPK
jgi:PBP1b-binding outer membrane lipoprotein LpoB